MEHYTPHNSVVLDLLYGFCFVQCGKKCQNRVLKKTRNFNFEGFSCKIGCTGVNNNDYIYCREFISEFVGENRLQISVLLFELWRFPWGALPKKLQNRLISGIFELALRSLRRKWISAPKGPSAWNGLILSPFLRISQPPLKHLACGINTVFDAAP